MSELYDIFREHPHISTDTRDIGADSIFFALRGATFDGNRFAAEALEKGAAYAVVDDPAAVTKLKTKLAKLEAAQQTMKDVNAYWRKHKTLKDCPYLTEEEIAKAEAAMGSDCHLEDKPFASYSLSNNNANIRRIKERITELEKRSSSAAPAGWEFDGGKVVMNTDENRIQVFFDEKPDNDTRTELRGAAFKWAPSQGAWQRQLTDNAIRAAKYLKCLKPTD